MNSSKPASAQQLPLAAFSQGSITMLDGGERIRLDDKVDFWPATQAWRAIEGADSGTGTTSMLAYLVRRREEAGDPVPEPVPIPTRRTVTCPYCEQGAGLFTGQDVYPHRKDLHERRFWVCWPCNAWVGCHETGDKTEPLGPLADEALRDARIAAHDAFAPLWQRGEMSKDMAYSWLARQLGMPVMRCRITWLSLEECRQVVRVVADMQAR